MTWRIYCTNVFFSDENEESGFVIDTEEVGLRLKAFEYWKCSETGLTSDPATNGIKFVLAESLPGQGILNIHVGSRHGANYF